MTPEERFTTMQNLLQAMMEHHAKQQERIEKQTEQIDKHTLQIEKHTEQIEKQNAGIRDLVVVSRTVLSSIQELHDVQAATDGKLNVLIDTVERIIRRRESPE